jgi:hypothetical protein
MLPSFATTAVVLLALGAAPAAVTAASCVYTEAGNGRSAVSTYTLPHSDGWSCNWLKKTHVADACGKTGLPRYTDVGCSDAAGNVVLQVRLSQPSDRNCAAPAVQQYLSNSGAAAPVC